MVADECECDGVAPCGGFFLVAGKQAALNNVAVVIVP